MAKKGRRNIVQGVGPDSTGTGKDQDYYNRMNIEQAGKQLDQVQDIVSAYENIFDLQQKMNIQADQLFGVEQKTLNLLGAQENKLKMIELKTQNLLDMKREDRNVLTIKISLETVPDSLVKQDSRGAGR